ncbi:MAG TPA: hypothetical protein VN255_09045 [Mycobacterium sp.]|nr:hypothetical protein [Mycobacterium sp.]HWT48702.1 hypothetical protein [Mycobacterium sp.]
MGTPFGIIADGLAAAVNMTECAVVLFEAVSRDPSGHGSQRGSHAENRPATAHSLRLLDLLAGVHD